MSTANSATRIGVLAQKHQIKNYINGAIQNNLISDATFLAPIVRVPSLVNTVWKFDRLKPFRTVDTKRAQGGRANRVTYGGETEDITLETHALDTGIDIASRSDEELIMDLKMQADLAAQAAGLSHLQNVLTAIEGASGLNTDTLDISDDDPVEEFNGWIKNILLSCGGFAPNVKIRALWGYEAARKVLADAQVISRISGGATTSNPAVATLDVFSRMLLMPGTEHRVCTAITDTAVMDSATETRSFVNDNEILLVAASPNPTTADASAFKTFWMGSDMMTQRYWKSDDGRVENMALDWFWRIYAANSKAAYKITVQA